MALQGAEGGGSLSAAGIRVGLPLQLERVEGAPCHALQTQPCRCKGDPCCHAIEYSICCYMQDSKEARIC